MRDRKIILSKESIKPEEKKSSSSSNDNYDLLYKLKIVGDAGTGKSCLLLRFTEGSYTNSYIHSTGVDYKIKTIELNGKRIKLQTWDTAGQEQFRITESNYSRGFHALIVTFDLTDHVSFNNVNQWLAEIEKNATENVAILLVATKSDLPSKRVVALGEVETLMAANPRLCGYIETSALTGENVNEAFGLVAEVLLEGQLKFEKKLKSEKEDPLLENFKKTYHRLWEYQSVFFKLVPGEMKNKINSNSLTMDDVRTYAKTHPGSITDQALKEVEMPISSPIIKKGP